MANQFALPEKKRSRSDFLKEQLEQNRQRERAARQEAAFRANYPGQIATQGTSTTPVGDILTGLLERLGMGGQRAYDVGQGVETAAEMTPYSGLKKAAAGDVTALEDLVGGAPAKAIFLGLTSRLADKPALETAKKMLEEGASREDVLKKTGWFKQHGDWKFEISDRDAQLSDTTVDKLLGKEGEAKGSLGPSSQADLFGPAQEGIFEHPELFEAHPQLADIPSETSLSYITSGGGYSPQSGIGVMGRGTGEVRDIGLHEMQHAVQEAEGFPRGGNPSDRSLQKAMGKIKPQAQALYDRLDRERVDWIYQRAGIPEGERFGLDSDAVRALDRAGKEWRELNPDKGRLLDQYFGIGHMGGAGPRAGYHHLAGEVEARNVQKRKDMTMEERRATAPWATQDVPDELQIVRKQVGPGSFEASAPTRDDLAQIVRPAQERSGVFDYSAKYPPRDLGVERFRPKKVPERTTDLLARPEVFEGMMEGVERGRPVMDWYETGPLRKSFEDQFGPEQGIRQFDQFIDAVGATSPRAKVGENVRNASYYYGMAQPFPGRNSIPSIEDLPPQNPAPYGHIAQKLHRLNAERTVFPGGAGYDPKQNPKPIAFTANLKGDPSVATIDTHAFRAPAILGQDPRFLERSYRSTQGAELRNPQREFAEGTLSMPEALGTSALWSSKPLPTEYAAFEDFYKRLGQEAGMTPAEAQAASWVGHGATTGLESAPKSFMDFVEERILKTARERGLDPMEVWRRAASGKQPLLSIGGAVGGAAALAGQEEER